MFYISVIYNLVLYRMKRAIPCYKSRGLDHQERENGQGKNTCICQRKASSMYMSTQSKQLDSVIGAAQYIPTSTWHLDYGLLSN